MRHQRRGKRIVFLYEYAKLVVVDHSCLLMRKYIVVFLATIKVTC